MTGSEFMMARPIGRLALGAVQFGLPYGISNTEGRVSLANAAAIVTRASSLGLDTLDTAVGYGESERTLGEIGVVGWQVVSKLPAMPEPCSDVHAWVQDTVDGALRRLRIPRLNAVLLHCPQDLLRPQGAELYRALGALKESGRARKIGVSIYDPAELAALWPRFTLDLVQAPFNVIDRRLASSGWLARLHGAGIELHVRSVFLQGLLLMSRDTRPPAFDRWQPIWETWERWLVDGEVSPVQACLAFALSRPEFARVLVGVESVSQLEEIAAAAERPGAPPPESLASHDLDLLHPSNWRML